MELAAFEDYVRAAQTGPDGPAFDTAFQALGNVDSFEAGEARIARHLEEQVITGGVSVTQAEVFAALLTGLRETQAALANGMRTVEDHRNVRIWQRQVLPLFRSPRAEGLIGRMSSRRAEIENMRVETSRHLDEWHQRKHLRAVIVYSLGVFVLGSLGLWAIWLLA